MNLFNFLSKFPDEASCRHHFRQLRERKGVTCKRCECSDHYWLASKSMFQCKKCQFRTSLRSGTVMENSKLPFRYWYMAMHLLTSTKKGFSALEFKRQIGHKRYEPVWAMLHKLRMIMGQGDAKEELRGWVELDEGFFEVRIGKKEKKSLKRGRGSQRQATVLVMAESELVDVPRKNAKSRRCGRFRMKVIPDAKANTITNEAEGAICTQASILTDNFRAYCHLKDRFAFHEPVQATGEQAMVLLPWVHTAISNAKRTLLGIFHGISEKHIQNYLDEFCYKLNRRYLGEMKFEALLNDSLNHWNPNHRWQSTG